MIQRVQSIYLLFAGLLIAALYLFPVLNTLYVGVIPENIRVTGVYQDAGGQQTHTIVFIALTAATALVALLPVAVIFLYKRRQQQVALCYSALLVILGYSFWVAETIRSVIHGAPIHPNNYGIGLFLMPISILMVFLAIRAIRSDEKLVRSADRLR